MLISIGCSGSVDEGPATGTCDGRNLITNTGTVVCPLTCEVDHCTAASNIPVDIQRACTSEAFPFAASTGASLGANLELSCNGCQAPNQTATAGRVRLMDLAVFCYCAEVGAGKTLPVPMASTPRSCCSSRVTS
jgi:hypothetical protein